MQRTEPVSYPQLAENPAAYEGHRIVLGGQVLRAQRLTDRTEIEVLQLPLDSRYEPNPSPSASQGRFLTYQSKDFLDPAAIPPGTLITVVGEGKGCIQKRLDEAEYRFPVIETDYLQTWPVIAPGYAYYPYWNDPYDAYWPYYPYYYDGYYGPFLHPLFSLIVVPPRRHHFGGPGLPTGHFHRERHR